MLSRALFAVTAATLVAIAPLQSQAPRKLGAPTATLEQEFTGIEGVRELKDGRLILLDARDVAIHVIDLKAKTVKKVGRDGDGPGEYRLPLEIWPIGGDSSVVRDMARFGKLMVVTPAGEIGGFVGMLDSALSTRNFNSTGADLAGRFYGMEYTAQMVNDSARIVRWDRRKGTRDTVARFMTALAPPSMKESDMIRDASGRVIGYRPGPPRAFVAYNQWSVGGDGRIAILYAAPYHVAYVGIDGKRVVGPMVNYRPIDVTEAEKEEWRSDYSRARPSISSTRGGPTVATFRKPPGGPPADVTFADVLPAFGQFAGRFASDGMLWVKRNTSAGASPLYDLFDAAGKVAFQLELPPKTKLVGFGAGVVYLARVDDDDLHYLERYKLPGK